MYTVHVPVLISTTSEEDNRNHDHAGPAWGGPCNCCPGSRQFAAGLGACRGRTQPPATASSIVHRGRMGLVFNIGTGQMGARPRPGLPAHAQAWARAWPAEPPTRHQPGTRRDAACEEPAAQGAAAKTPKAAAKPGPCMSTDNLKQDTQSSNTTGRRHRHTQGKQNGLSLPIFVSIDTGNAERESNQRSTRMGLHEWNRVNRHTANEKGASRPRRGKTTRMHDEEATLLATSNKSPQQRSLLRTRTWLKICLLGASAHTIPMRCIYECRTQ